MSLIWTAKQEDNWSIVWIFHYEPEIRDDGNKYNWINTTYKCSHLIVEHYFRRETLTFLLYLHLLTSNLCLSILLPPFRNPWIWHLCWPPLQIRRLLILTTEATMHVTQRKPSEIRGLYKYPHFIAMFHIIPKHQTTEFLWSYKDKKKAEFVRSLGSSRCRLEGGFNSVWFKFT